MSTLAFANPEGRPSFPSALRREREKMGKTLHDVATHVGVKRDVADAWELGTMTPTRFEYKRLIHMLRALRFYPPPQIDSDASDEAPDSEPAVEPAPLPADEPEPQTWGDALRAERTAEGLTQRDLGELLGVSPGAVTFWEQGRGISIEMSTKCSELFPRLKNFRAPVASGRVHPPHRGPLTAPLGLLAGLSTTTEKPEAPKPFPVKLAGFVPAIEKPPAPKPFPMPPMPPAPQKLVPFRRPAVANAADIGDAGDETTIPPFVRSARKSEDTEPAPVAIKTAPALQTERTLDGIANDLRAELAKRAEFDKRIEALRAEMREHIGKLEALL